MSSNDDHILKNSNIEKWLESFFLNPLCSYLDHTQFRIDVFETDTEWIIEAFLEGYSSKEISVFIEEKKMIITAASLSPSNDKIKTRTVEFPFQIVNKNITAVFSNGVLEIHIPKEEKISGVNRYLPLL